MSSRHRAGQALVELAIVLPLFLTLLFAIVDFGRIFHIWSGLNLQCVEAAREGAKRKNQLLGRNVFNGDSHMEIASITRAFVMHQSPAIHTSRFRTKTGLPASGPELLGVGTSDREITVTARYSVQLMTPFLERLFISITGKPEIVLTAAATERKE